MIFFTSDQHFDHKNILTYCDRPFSSVEEMNAELICRHNSVVSPDDIIYHLGDFCLHANIKQFLKQLNGTHILVPGNHDRAKSQKQQSNLLQQGFSKILYPISEYILVIKKSHFPIILIHDKSYLPNILPDNQIVLFGHSHQKKPCSVKNYINVGVDAWNYTPVSEKQIISLLEEKPYFNS